MKRLILLLVALYWLTPSLAAAAPVAAAVVSWLALTGTAATIATFVITSALTAAANFALTALTTSRQRSTQQERQASVTTLSLGEVPREVIFGQAATGGTLLDAFNWGGPHGTDWEVLVIQLADHRCHSLVAFYVGDQRFPFTASGVQDGFGGQLEIYWHEGAEAQPADSYLVANAPGGSWAASDRLAGCAYVVVAYKADAPDAAEPIWPQGRPSFLWEVKGAYLYDPRKDSTVPGGDGLHRWTDPSTWEWSDNAYLARYAYTRGLYAGDWVANPAALLIGRGLSADEAPPERVFAPANLCDEAVALKAGGTEPRYRVNGVIRADETFITADELFAAAMAGVIVQRDGGVEIEPGEARSVVVTLTDGDMLVGAVQRVESFRPDAERVNTVTPRYVEPAQLWRETAAPVRRSTEDLADDGGQRSKALSLALVTSQTQAQRVAEIDRRLGRRERRASITLGPRFSWLEEGDWIAWTSDRHFLGDTVTFRVEAASLGPDYRMGLVLREISASVYSWTAATDEGTPGQAPVDAAGALDPLELEDVVITSFPLTGDGGDVLPAVRATWATPVEIGIRAVRLELRLVGETEVAATLAPNPAAGEMVTTNGVPSAGALEGRLVPLGVDGRRVTPSAWVEVTSDGISLAALEAALSDGSLTPGEKLYVVPQIYGLIDARATMRANADAVNALYSNNLERVAYEDAATALDAVLATWTTPVAWSDSSDVTEIADPAAFIAAFRASISSERDLQGQITYLWGQVVTDLSAELADAISDGNLTPAEKMIIIPQINGMIGARAALRDRADALGLTYAASSVRAGWEDWAAALDAALASYTTPVAWNNYTDSTTIASPAGFREILEEIVQRTSDLQTAIDKVAGDKTRFFDTTGINLDYQTMLFGWNVNGGVGGRASQPLTSSDGAVAVAAHSILFPNYSGGNVSVSVPATTFYGLASGTTYTVYYRPQYFDWAIVPSSSEAAYATSRDGWMFIGRIMTSTASVYNPPSFDVDYGLIGYCVAADAYLASGKRAGQAQVGDDLVLLNPAGDGVMAGEVTAMGRGVEPCLIFETATARLTVSQSTPMMTRQGPGYAPRPVRAAAFQVGDVVPVLAGKDLVWEPVTAITAAGRRPVAKISADHGVYAASDVQGGPWMLTHNIYAKF